MSGQELFKQLSTHVIRTKSLPFFYPHSLFLILTYRYFSSCWKAERICPKSSHFYIPFPVSPPGYGQQELKITPNSYQHMNFEDFFQVGNNDKHIPIIFLSALLFPKQGALTRGLMVFHGVIIVLGQKLIEEILYDITTLSQESIYA